MPLSAKICGLSDEATLSAALASGASHVGFVAFPASPRNLDPGALAGLSAKVPSHVGRVGVLVDPDDVLLAAVAPHVDTLQLHRTSPERAATIRARYGREVWTAVAVKTRADLDTARAFAGAADRVLYDAKTPDDAALPGGMGLRFDWSLLEGFRHPMPWLLSGGLDARNVAEAARRTGASLVDVSSGVETAPGVKDVEKIGSFLKAIAAL